MSTWNTIAIESYYTSWNTLVPLLLKKINPQFLPSFYEHLLITFYAHHCVKTSSFLPEIFLHLTMSIWYLVWSSRLLPLFGGRFWEIVLRSRLGCIWGVNRSCVSRIILRSGMVSQRPNLQTSYYFSWNYKSKDQTNAQYGLSQSLNLTFLKYLDFNPLVERVHYKQAPSLVTNIVKEM